MVDLVGTSVIVDLIDGSRVKGALFSIDPENGNVVLFRVRNS